MIAKELSGNLFKIGKTRRLEPISFHVEEGLQTQTGESLEAAELLSTLWCLLNVTSLCCANTGRFIHPKGCQVSLHWSFNNWQRTFEPNCRTSSLRCLINTHSGYSQMMRDDTKSLISSLNSEKKKNQYAANPPGFMGLKEVLLLTYSAVCCAVLERQSTVWFPSSFDILLWRSAKNPHHDESWILLVVFFHTRLGHERSFSCQKEQRMVPKGSSFMSYWQRFHTYL